MSLNIAFLPSAVQGVVQDGILQSRFLDSLTPVRRWRTLAQRILHTGRIGEKVTMTRPGLISPSTEASATLAAGGEPDLLARSIEKFSFQVRSMGKALDIQLPASFFAQASTFLDDSEKLGIQAEMTLDGIARERLIRAYSGGDTFTEDNPGATTSVDVADCTGFDTVMVNGDPTAVSVSNTLPVTIGGTARLVSACVADDASSPPRGPGTLTITVALDYAQFDRVLRTDAATIVRQTSRATDRLIVAGDTATMATFRRAKQVLVDHFVPPIDGAGNHGCAISATTKNALFADTEILNANQGRGAEAGGVADGRIGTFAGIAFFELPQERMPASLSGGNLQTTIQRSLMYGADALVEAYVPEEEFANQASPAAVAGMNHLKMPIDEVLAMVYRAPLDTYGRQVRAAWVANVDFVVPSDVNGLSGAQRFKRACMIHTAG
jgi:hypothetical protein